MNLIKYVLKSGDILIAAFIASLFLTVMINRYHYGQLVQTNSYLTQTVNSQRGYPFSFRQTNALESLGTSCRDNQTSRTYSVAFNTFSLVADVLIWLSIIYLIVKIIGSVMRRHKGQKPEGRRRNVIFKALAVGVVTLIIGALLAPHPEPNAICFYGLALAIYSCTDFILAVLIFSIWKASDNIKFSRTNADLCSFLYD